MVIPRHAEIMLPLLRLSKDGQEHSVQEVIDPLAESFNLTPEERQQLLPSGRQAVFYHRLGWAKIYLTKAGLLEATSRAHFRITSRGLDVLAQNPEALNARFLSQFPEFAQFQTSGAVRGNSSDESITSNKTPEELLEESYQSIKEELAEELLDWIMKATPKFFERLVVDLLVAMGYGGNFRDAGEAIGGSGDGGVDGIIKEDKLGLDVVYVQAKRWDSPVGVKEIRDFVGSLAGKHATKGVFITTSSFSKEALEYVKGINYKVVLVDGETLTDLMIEYDVGVSPRMVYEVKRVDADYFEEV